MSGDDFTESHSATIEDSDSLSLGCLNDYCVRASCEVT